MADGVELRERLPTVPPRAKRLAVRDTVVFVYPLPVPHVAPNVGVPQVEHCAKCEAEADQKDRDDVMGLQIVRGKR